jgi:charged multivesicular body protein 3
MQIDEAFVMTNLQNKIAQSTTIMKEVNSLVRLPQITGTMRELEQELLKSGIINEMVGDTVDMLDEDEELEEEVDEEVNRIISTLTSERFSKVENAPVSRFKEPTPEPEDLEEDEEVLSEMRERLKALQS